MHISACTTEEEHVVCMWRAHGAVEGLAVLVGAVEEALRGAASERRRGAVTVDRLQTHRPLHLPWSCVGSR